MLGGALVSGHLRADVAHEGDRRLERASGVVDGVQDVAVLATDRRSGGHARAAEERAADLGALEDIGGQAELASGQSDDSLRGQAECLRCRRARADAPPRGVEDERGASSGRGEKRREGRAAVLGISDVPSIASSGIAPSSVHRHLASSRTDRHPA